MLKIIATDSDLLLTVKEDYMTLHLHVVAVLYSVLLHLTCDVCWQVRTPYLDAEI